jgi:hypothetical protein
MSFFDKNTNPFLGMFEQLSQEQQEEYRKSGEYMYSFVDFETGNIIQEHKIDDYDTQLKSIKDAIRSGISEEYLSQHEKEILEHSKK